MRTLKKTLSFVLVLAMALSLFGTAFAQLDKYADAESIGDAYVEAVDVLTGIGVLEGMDEDTFAPQGNYTREQAAKIIAYIAAGPEAAEKMTASCDVFDDVPATKWSAGYIAYCVRAGIIDGYGNGKFGPADYVTGYQFAKMLLTAVGYGVNGEYTGAKWSVSVAKDAIPNGLFAGDLDAATNEPITREQAALIAFNALLNLNLVTWDSRLNTYVTNYNNDDANEPGDRPCTLGDENFGLHVHTGTDELGFAGYEWADGDENVVSEWYMTDAILGHYTDTYGLKKADMFKNYAWDADVEIWQNGTLLWEGIDSESRFAEQGVLETIADWYQETGWDFYLVDTAGDGDVDKIVTTAEYLAEVVDTTSASEYFDEKATLVVYTGLNETTTVELEIAGLAEGQYLLVAPAVTAAANKADGDFTAPAWIHTPTQYTGKIEEVNTNVARLIGGYELPNVKVDGVETKFSTLMGKLDIDPTYLMGISADKTYEGDVNVDIREIVFGNIYTFTYDCFGYIIGVELLVPVCEIAPNFVHVDAVSLKPIHDKYNLYDIYGMEMRIQVTAMDGTTTTYDYPVYNGDDEGEFYINVLLADNFDEGAAVANKIYTEKLYIPFEDADLTMGDLSDEFDAHDLFYLAVNEAGVPTLGYFTAITNGSEYLYSYQADAGEALSVGEKYAEIDGTYDMLMANEDTVLTIKWDNADLEQYVGYDAFPEYEFVAGESWTYDEVMWNDANVEINYVYGADGVIDEILINHITYKAEEVIEPFFFIPTTEVAVTGETITIKAVDESGVEQSYVVCEDWAEHFKAGLTIGYVFEGYLNADGELVVIGAASAVEGTVWDVQRDYFVIDLYDEDGNWVEAKSIYFADGIIYDGGLYMSPSFPTLKTWNIKAGDDVVVFFEEGTTAGGRSILNNVFTFAWGDID